MIKVLNTNENVTVYLLYDSFYSNHVDPGGLTSWVSGPIFDAVLITARICRHVAVLVSLCLSIFTHPLFL